MTNSTSSATPYADAAGVYRDLGWAGVLPADLNGRPGHVPAGYSGGSGGDPDDAQVQRWIEGLGGHNVALRLPDGVLGIDVDVYGEKRGDATIAYLAHQLDAGELPATWTSTARGPGQPSRIHLFRVPRNVAWRSDLGRGSAVEIIRRAHRWVRVWPSVNQRLVGRASDVTYRWYRPDGTVSDRPPRPEELEELPAAWIALLREDGPAAVPPGAERAERERTGNRSGEDAPVVDQDGQPVDPALVIERGIPIGSQQTELFRYMCSLRARNMHRAEMVALGMIALQRMPNDPEREPWTADDVVAVVDHVRRDYGPGTSSALPAGLQAFADGLRATTSVDEPPLVEETASDLGNSLRFARLFRDRARYAADVQQWYVWDGRRWAPDRTGKVVDLTKHVIDDVRRQAFTDPDHRDEWLGWASRSEALARRKAIVEGAESEPSVVVMSDVFDRDPELLVVRNGTVDLRSGELREARPDDLCSHLAEVDYDPDARWTKWDEHVALMCKGDPELMSYLARAVGYSLTGNVGARAFFFLEGSGSNGKNAFIEPIMQLMGSYAQTASPSLLTGSEQDHPTAIADLLGARLVFIDEARKERRLNTERIKALTGSKRVKARKMRKDFFEFDARFKLWIAGNGTPKMDDESDGVWKRLHRVRCMGKVDPSRRRDRYGDVLYAEEASGILNWALAGLRSWRGRGLDVPAAVALAVEEYRHDENYVQQFAEEYVVVTGDDADRLTVNELYSVYQRWAAFSGLKGLDFKNRVHFSRSLGQLAEFDEERGVRRVEWKVDGVKARGFCGVRWARSPEA